MDPINYVQQRQLEFIGSTTKELNNLDHTSIGQHEPQVLSNRCGSRSEQNYSQPQNIQSVVPALVWQSAVDDENICPCWICAVLVTQNRGGFIWVRSALIALTTIGMPIVATSMLSPTLFSLETGMQSQFAWPCAGTCNSRVDWAFTLHVSYSYIH